MRGATRTGLVTAAITAALVAGPALPASAGTERMHLDCGGAVGVIERTNGASWWGADGTVYTTKHLKVVTADGVFEKSYGHVAREHLVCHAAHDVDDFESDWTVHLVPSG